MMTVREIRTYLRNEKMPQGVRVFPCFVVIILDGVQPRGVHVTKQAILSLLKGMPSDKVMMATKTREPGGLLLIPHPFGDSQ